MDLTPSERKIQNYLNIDALQLKKTLSLRLAGERNITDQFFAGSNINTLLDTLAYTYENLVFYLSQTASDLSFSNSFQYHHINRLAKLVNYHPRGPVASFTNYTLKLESGSPPIPDGVYVIPRYSYVSFDRGAFSLSDDVFCVIKEGRIVSVDWTDGSPAVQIAHEGRYLEYPIQYASGEVFEKIILNRPNKENAFYSFEHVDVYVKSSSTNNKWVQYLRVQDLFTTPGTFPGYTLRFNEYGRIEIQFGNGITGKKLSPGDQIAIYVLVSNKNIGTFPSNFLADHSLVFFNSPQFQTLLADLGTISDLKKVFSSSYPILKKIKITNPYPTLPPLPPESAIDIKNNIPLAIQTHSKCHTLLDYWYKVKTFAEIQNIGSFLILDNKSFSNLYNEYQKINLFFDSNKFFKNFLYQSQLTTGGNNEAIYVLVLSRNEDNPYLSPAQKIQIQKQLEQIKNISHNVYVLDALVLPIRIGLKRNRENTKEKTELIFEKNNNVDVNDSNIISQAQEIFKTYFKWENQRIGNTINFFQIESELNNIPGVKNIYTKTGSRIRKGLWFIIDSESEDSLEIDSLDFIPQIPFGTYYFKKENLNDLISISYQPLQITAN